MFHSKKSLFMKKHTLLGNYSPFRTFNQIKDVVPILPELLTLVWEYFAHFGWWESWLVSVSPSFTSETYKLLKQYVEKQKNYEVSCKKIFICPLIIIPERDELEIDTLMCRSTYQDDLMYVRQEYTYQLLVEVEDSRNVVVQERMCHSSCNPCEYEVKTSNNLSIAIHLLHFFEPHFRPDFGPHHFSVLPKSTNSYVKTISLKMTADTNMFDWFYQPLVDNGVHGDIVFGVRKEMNFGLRLFNMLKTFHSLFITKVPLIEDELALRLGFIK
jgi:hypothetical protein